MSNFFKFQILSNLKKKFFSSHSEKLVVSVVFAGAVPVCAEQANNDQSVFGSSAQSVGQ